MKDTAILVNISRGKVVDEAALERALVEGRIKGAGLDALAEEPLPASSPLWDLPQRVDHAPCRRWRRTPTVSAYERTHPRQYAALSFRRAPQACRQNSRRHAARVFETALFAICLQIQARFQAAEERYRRGSRVRQV